MSDATAKYKMGLGTSTALVVGNMIGAGFFLMPSALASFGAIGLLGWGIAAAGALVLARVFSNVSQFLPGTAGGPYAYTRAGLGDFAGFLIAWGYWISCWTGVAAMAVSLVATLSSFFPLLATSSTSAILTGLVAIWVLTWINTLGIRQSGFVQRMTTLLKLLPIVVLIIFGLWHAHWDHFTPLSRGGQSVISALLTSAALTFFAFSGVESATIPASEVADPLHTIPRATMLGTGVTTLIYILGTFCVMGVLEPSSLEGSVTPLSDAAVAIWGPGARYWMAAGVAVAIAGAMNGWILVQGQVSKAVAQDKLFPSVFKNQNRRGVPAKGLVIASLLLSLFMIMNYTRGLVDQFKFLILVATLLALIPYIFVATSYVILLIRKGGLSRGDWVRVLLLAGTSFAFSLLEIIGSGSEIVFWGFILLLAGIPLYVWMLWKNRFAIPH